MNIKKFLKVGQKIEIFYNNEFSHSMVTNVMPGNTITAAHPMKGRDYVRIPKDSVLEIICYKGSGIYCFEAVLVENLKTNDLLQIKLKVLHIQKIQRRNFFRLPVILDIKILYFPQAKGEFAVKSINCYTVNLSAGGICVKCQQSIPVGSKVICKLSIDEGTQLTLDGVVVWIKDIRKSNFRYYLGIRFLIENEETRRKIIKYINESQAKLQN